MPDVLVVGGGPAGLSAALAARGEGAEVLVIERDDRLGGVLMQCIHDGFGVLEFGERLTGPEYAHRHTAAIRRSRGEDNGISVMTGAFLHSLSQHDGRWAIEIITSAGIRSVVAPSVVMATGCRERTDRQIYLHGDRPAGIFTAGQAQRLINIDGVMPGHSVVILGSGDIGLIMARRFVLEGATVHGVYEVKPNPSGLARNVAQCLEDWDIPLHLSMTVTEVHGRDRVDAVTVCPVDESGRADLDSALVVACDTLVLSVGLIPENDVIEDIGVQLDPATGGPAVTQDRATGLDGLFVCGNALMVYDLVDYVSECGRAAGIAAARHAGQCAKRVDPAGTGIRARVQAVRVDADGSIGQIVPQSLDPSKDPPPALFFRPGRSSTRSRLTVARGTELLASRRLTYLRPAEMVRYQLSESTWAGVRKSPGPVSVALEAEGG